MMLSRGCATSAILHVCNVCDEGRLIGSAPIRPLACTTKSDGDGVPCQCRMSEIWLREQQPDSLYLTYGHAGLLQGMHWFGAPIALAIGLVVLLIVRHKVAQREAVMGSDEVDAMLRASPPKPLPPTIVRPPAACMPMLYVLR